MLEWENLGFNVACVNPLVDEVLINKRSVAFNELLPGKFFAECGSRGDDEIRDFMIAKIFIVLDDRFFNAGAG